MRQILQARFGQDLYRLGYRIYTTLDLDMQLAAERALESQLRAVEAMPQAGLILDATGIVRYANKRAEQRFPATRPGDAFTLTFRAPDAEVIRAKTAVLFQAACEVGAMSSGADETGRQALATYGLELGKAFQLVDDALDYGGQSGTLGKNVGDDFREGKVTLPVILSYRRGTPEERAFWTRAPPPSPKNRKRRRRRMASRSHTTRWSCTASAPPAERTARAVVAKGARPEAQRRLGVALLPHA